MQEEGGQIKVQLQHESGGLKSRQDHGSDIYKAKGRQQEVIVTFKRVGRISSGLTGRSTICR